MMPYILHAGLLLAACLVFYKILLQKETFFRLNRWILIACLILSFGLPLVEVPQQWSFRKAETTFIPATNTDTPQSEVTAVTDTKNESAPISNKKDINWLLIAWIVYWVGVVIFAINFLVQIAILYYRAYTRPVIRDGKFRIVELSGDKAPCSFGNNIFINPEKYDWETYNQILQHEKIHAQEKHTLDLLIAELVIIFQWFNPFAWWYRKELESNLEFLTDERFLHRPQAEKTAYQLSLVKVTAPHYPLSLTTNYNQSLLKKRVAMMNSKKSNVHTTWKYLFLFPVLVLSVCLLNKPVANAQNATGKDQAKNRNNNKNNRGMSTEGYWFATIKDDKVNMQFKNDEDEHGNNSTTFLLSDFKNMPREGSGTFTVTRDAGTMEFTGKFEGNQGMGRYKFNEDKSYAAAMEKEGIKFDDERDQMVFFMIDVKSDYVPMLKRNGFTGIRKDQVIPLAALKVNEQYIQDMKKAGLGDLGADELIPLKGVNVTPEYVEEIRKAGYPNVTAHQLISFKAQHIDAKYISDMRKAGLIGQNGKNENNNRKGGGASADNIAALKALNIDEAYVRSMEEVGYKDLSADRLIAFKGANVTPEYIRQWQSAGYKDLSPDDLLALKGQDITPEYLTSFSAVGFPKLNVHKSLPFKALNVTPEYIKSFQEVGYSDLSENDVVGLKSQDIRPALVKEYNDLGFGKVALHEVMAAKATGTTPQYIKSMQEKGHKFKNLQKYITLKTVTED